MDFKQLSLYLKDRQKTGEPLLDYHKDFTEVLLVEIQKSINILTLSPKKKSPIFFGQPENNIRLNGTELISIYPDWENNNTFFNTRKMIKFLKRKKRWIENNSGDIFLTNLININLLKEGNSKPAILNFVFSTILQVSDKNFDIISKDILTQLEHYLKDTFNQEEETKTLILDRKIYSYPGLIHSDDIGDEILVTKKLKRFYELMSLKPAEDTWDSLSNFKITVNYLEEIKKICTEKNSVESLKIINRLIQND